MSLSLLSRFFFHLYGALARKIKCHTLPVDKNILLHNVCRICNFMAPSGKLYQTALHIRYIYSNNCPEYPDNFLQNASASILSQLHINRNFIALFLIQLLILTCFVFVKLNLCMLHMHFYQKLLTFTHFIFLLPRVCLVSIRTDVINICDFVLSTRFNCMMQVYIMLYKRRDRHTRISFTNTSNHFYYSKLDTYVLDLVNKQQFINQAILDTSFCSY